MTSSPLTCSFDAKNSVMPGYLLFKKDFFETGPLIKTLADVISANFKAISHDFLI